MVGQEAMGVPFLMKGPPSRGLRFRETYKLEEPLSGACKFFTI